MIVVISFNRSFIFNNFHGDFERLVTALRFIFIKLILANVLLVKCTEYFLEKNVKLERKLGTSNEILDERCCFSTISVFA